MVDEIINTDVLRVGNTVYWKGSWGTDDECLAKITGIMDNKNGSKSGRHLPSFPWAKINGRNIIVDLDNGHWAYGDQLRKV